MGVMVEARDFFRQPLTKEEIRQLAGNLPIEEIFSWRGRKARELGLTPGQLGDDEMLEMMAQEPGLIRRPIIVIGNRTIAGYDRSAIEQAVREVR